MPLVSLSPAVIYFYYSTEEQWYLPKNEGTQEAKSIQVTVCSLLGKSEYLRQIIELVDIDLLHNNILWIGSIKKQSNSAT